jgi:hypothetical protein
LFIVEGDMDELELEPPIPTAEELQAYADRERERIPNYELLWLLNQVMWREAWAQAKEEVWRTQPWVRQWPELFR